MRYSRANKVLLEDKCPVVVYTMAKVASTSIYHSLKNQTDYPAFHVHSLNESVIKASEKQAMDSGILPSSRQVGGLIYAHKIKQNKPLIIISSVREPIARNISAFFDAFSYHVGMEADKWNGEAEELMQSYFLDKLDHNYPLNWFDNEFKRMTLVDVYESPFDSNKKYIVLNKDNLKILIFRVDLSDADKEELIKKELDLDTFSLMSLNIGSEKKYANLYTNFKKDVKLPQSYVDSMLNSKYARHFYSDQELQNISSKYI